MAEALLITVCFSPAPRQVFECTVQMPLGGTVAQAVLLARQQTCWPAAWDEASGQSLTPGIWGRKAGWNTPLRSGDRVELSRPLRVDPKVARRERFSRQGARRAGLFAQKRPGAAKGD
ncbi:MAG: RnfH family protein [Limnohabitans sp.]